MNASEFTKKFNEFEIEKDMFNLRIDKKEVWVHLRWMIHVSLKIEMGIYKDPNRFVAKSEKTKESIGEKIKKNIICNQYFARQRDVLIIGNARKVYEEGKYRCIYTDLLDKNLKRTHYVWDTRNSAGQFLIQDSPNIIYFDESRFVKCKNKKSQPTQLTKKWFDENIVIPIESYFDIRVSTKAKKEWFLHINTVFWASDILINYYIYMLKKIKPKVIVLTAYYNIYLMLLCAVAKKLNIPVMEIQHGIMGEEHIAYNYPEGIRTRYVPDYLLVYGEYDKRNIHFPIPLENIIPVGYPELERNSIKAKQNKNVNKKTKQLLFISVLEEPLIAQYANSLALLLDPEMYHVILKLHPMDCTNWRDLIGNDISAKNLEIVDDEYACIYTYLSKADWVIGTFSTVLMEATMFDTKIAVLNTPNCSAMKMLYESGNALLIDSKSELIKAVKEDTFKPQNRISIFEKDSLNKTIAAIEHAIKENS